MPSRFASLLAVAAWFANAGQPLQAQTQQQQQQASSATLIADAISAWATEYEHQRLSPRGVVRSGASLQPRYVALARLAGLVEDRDEGRLTHLDVLGKLLFAAERNPSDEVAAAVLGIAAVGLDRSLIDRETIELRDLGHWTLMRMQGQGIWFVVMRAAAGERPRSMEEALSGPASLKGLGAGAARRVAALQLLGRKNLPIFRTTIEAALRDPEPRVRLGAAEGLLPPWRASTVHAVRNALLAERHPVVSQALARLIFAMLREPPSELPDEERRVIVAEALDRLGQCGWRTDLDLLDLVEQFPHKSAIPRLIELMDLEIRSPDALVAAINRRASPLVRERAGGLLRRMTGALVAVDDAAGWRDFWAREHERIVVPPTLPRPDANRTRSEFFGLPVTGGSVGFLIDNSGSMDSAVETTTDKKRGRAATKLQVAKEQLAHAVQTMAPESQFTLFTFADAARQWTAQPVRIERSSAARVTELLSRIGVEGATNLYDGLAMTLQWEGLGYGDVPKAGIDELFVLSDGEPTTGAVMDTDALLAMVRDVNKYSRIRIHCVHLGGGRGADLLRRLAEQNGGVFVQR